MCDVFSGYILQNGTAKFHTDEDVQAAHADNTHEINWHDMVGHSGWRKCFGNPPTGAKEIEGYKAVPYVLPFIDKMKKLIESSGNLNLRGLTSAQGLKLPPTVYGWLNLRDLTSAQGLKLPTTVYGWLDLRGLTSAQGLKLPTTVYGWLDLRGLTSAQGLKLPPTVYGWLDLSGLTSAEKSKLDLNKYNNIFDSNTS